MRLLYLRPSKTVFIGNNNQMKKTLMLSIAVTALCFSACGQKSGKDKCCSKKNSTITTTASTDTTTLVCKLTTEEQMKRSEELKATVFKKYEKLNEFPDAVELVYSDSKKYAPMLVEFINSERACCPFFTFDLKFLPNSDKVSLTIGRSPKIKEMVKTLIN
jgi:hypothetical protein